MPYGMIVTSTGIDPRTYMRSSSKSCRFDSLVVSGFSEGSPVFFLDSWYRVDGNARMVDENGSKRSFILN
jgi:hypothetical protein